MATKMTPEQAEQALKAGKIDNYVILPDGSVDVLRRSEDPGSTNWPSANKEDR